MMSQQLRTSVRPARHQMTRPSVRPIGCALALGIFALLGSRAAAADSLYVGDDSDYSVKRFDADTGAFLGTVVNSGSGGVNGLRGLLFEHPGGSGCGDLLLVNQNVNFNLNGEVLRYDGGTGAFVKGLIPATDPHGPYAPRGMALWNDSVLFIADQGNPPASGKLLAYSTDGTFLADLTPARPEFHPRAVVVGPDGKLYVTVRNFEFCGGSVLRFDPMTREFLDVFVANPVDCSQNANDLHRPEGRRTGRRNAAWRQRLRWRRGLRWNPTRNVRGATRSCGAMKNEVGSASYRLPTIALTLVAAFDPRALNRSSVSTANFGPRRSR
jgi:hypothetical protein